jgi:membrane associated rhomboid family serine protease
MRAQRQWQRDFSFGGRMPWAVGLLICITLALSLLTAFGDRHVGSLFELLALRPADVFRGQLWRLVTWQFIEPSPLGLIFTCLMLYWFGSPLAQQWGSPRFLTVFAAMILVAAVGTCLIAVVDPLVRAHQYLGGWVMLSAVTVAWGLTFPDQVVRIYLVLPIRGYWLAWLTVAFTVIYAVYTGWTHLLPELIAQGAVLAWIYRRRLRVRWNHIRRPTPVRPPQRRGEVIEFPRDDDDDDSPPRNYGPN